ncbi:FIMAH domain-containing protein [Paenibacillus ginsengarvi]|uniref:FIMAH domain-containing protein n=1 Tax=Paenibacillus ginsengarvi TaxID=400777 RepID=A0A3B0BUH6_9BACL|nr:heparinase II/III family protein [Paenibacillus ginsengarvi]RKN75869.1 hypothetical protein D7M11_25530 [Paenibacillus ginsengarvi]
MKKHMKRAVSFLLSLVLTLSVWTGWNAAQPKDVSAALMDPFEHLDQGKLFFSGPVNAYDLLVTPLAWPSVPGRVIAEADIQPISNAGSSWAPALSLYWDTAKYVSIGISSNGKFNLLPGGYTGTAPLGQTYRVRIVWENGTVQLWGGLKGTDPVLLKTTPAPASGPPPYLLVGKGFGSTSVYTNPFLANDYSDVGTSGNVYMDNITVFADETLKLEETFGSGIDPERWQVLMSPSAQPKPPVEFADLFPNWKAPAERGAASVPRVLYKEADWNDYFQKVQTSAEFRAFSDQQIQSLRNEAALAMGYDAAAIENMIPVTTPNANLFTPCPNAPANGFPHGSWQWSPSNPDVMYCGGMAFPNEQYPEEGVMIANWGGVEQRITYYNREVYDYNGFPLRPSFTSYIRAKKVLYMANIANKMAILYKLTGEAAYARQAKSILLRFAAVYPHWLLHSGYGEFADMDPKTAAFSIDKLPKPELTAPPNTPNRGLYAGYWMAGRGNADGLEGSFILPLVTAYDLLQNVQDQQAPLLNSGDRLVIERDLLLESAALFLADSSINNKSISNRTAAAAIGVAVDEPKLVRFGLHGFNQLMSQWYKADGSPAETPAYGLQVVGYLWRLGEILEGYSDPPSYTPPAGTSRIDNFTVYNRTDYRMVYKTLGDALLPSMKYPVVGDSYMTSAPAGYYLGLGAKRSGLDSLTSLLRFGGFTLSGLEGLFYRPDQLEQADPLVLPDVMFPQWKLAYLRGGSSNLGSSAILNLSDWGGHRHLDSLDLSYWANGGEALSDLGYLWDSPDKAMTSRSAAHNLVVVDKANQKDSGRGGSLGFYETPGPVKAAEASSRAYAQTDVYDRTVLSLGATARRPEYLVDLFRVRGGGTHDYMLHGATSGATSEHIQLSPGGSAAVAGYGLTDVKSAVTDQPWTVGWKNAGGTGWIKSWQVPMTVAESVYIGSGWGQRGTADSGAQLPYVVRRLNGAPQGSTFASVFESYTAAPSIQQVTALTATDSVYAPDVSASVGLAVSGAGWHDLVFSTRTGAASLPRTFREGGNPNQTVTFGGQLGVLSYEEQNGADVLRSAFLAGEGRIERDGRGIAIAQGEQKEGAIAQSFQDGFTASGIVADANLWIGSHVLIRKGTDWTAYPVLDVRTEGGKTRFVTYAAGDGYPFDGGEAWKLVPYATAELTATGEWSIVKSAGRAAVIDNEPNRPMTIAAMAEQTNQLQQSGDIQSTFAGELKYRLDIIRLLEEQGNRQTAIAYLQDFVAHLNDPSVRAQQLVSATAADLLNAAAGALLQGWAQA